LNSSPQSGLRHVRVGRLNLQLHKFHREWLALQMQARHGYRQLKPPRAGTPRIDEQDAVALDLSWLMRMSADNDMKASGCWVQVEGMNIMKKIEENLACFRDCRFGQRPRPSGSVHVSAHGNDGSEFFERGENFGLAHITGVKNQLRTTKLFDGLRSQQTVSV
jgi:hypothetical protein